MKLSIYQQNYSKLVVLRGAKLQRMTEKDGFAVERVFS